MSVDRTSSGGYGELLRQSLAAIDTLETEVERLRRELASRPTVDASEPIAIVGAACRFPGGVNDLNSYWHLLENGIDAVAPIPASRRVLGGWQSKVEDERSAGLVENLDQFDPRFFGISAREASTMDPQQRLVLEVGWEALENAGHAPGGLVGSSTGVFIGLSTTDYAQLIRESGAPSDVYVATGNAHNAAAGRLSFLLGLQGPSIAIDTACSSSLVAMHLACLSLRARNCRMALAGGVNVLLSEQPFECFTAWGMMAPNGKCKAFDASADGFVRSEGCGIVVLKRLSDALADGDNIRAVIRGSAVNQDGRSSGLTVPNGPAQEAVIRQALEAAKLEPGAIDYVEAHGTGTSLGDPIEAHALGSVLGVGRKPERPLLVGSVKTNLGHLESAAGVAGVLKVVLAMEKERVPAHLHFRQINPKIDWAGAAVEVSSRPHDWRRGQKRRIAGISSFGFSGTNAHVIIEEAPLAESKSAGSDRPVHIVALSSRTSEALDSTVANFRAALETNSNSLADIAYTANAGRSHFKERVAVTAKDVADLRDKLAAGNLIKGVEQSIRGKLAFLFTGQGSQWAGMCRELYETQPVFREALDECASRLRLEKPLLEVVYGSDAALLDQTAYTQPALFSIEWALAQLWKSWGIEPDVVFGHSVGEYAALCVAGVWTLEDGLRMIAERGRMMQALGPGWGMVSVQGAVDKVQDALRGMEEFVSIAAKNAPAATVISGRLNELAEVQKRLTAAGVKSVRLTVSHGFHSRQMQRVAEEFALFARQIPTRAPRCRIVSSVTGGFVNLEELRESSYWACQVRNAVEFQTSMETLAAAGFNSFVEIGPAPVLCGMGRQCIGTEGKLWAPSVRRERGAWDQILDSLAQLYVRGAEVNWSGFDAAYKRRRVVLPTYPFQRQRHWIESGKPAAKATTKTSGHPLLGERVDIAGVPDTHIWQTDISTAKLPYLVDHCVQERAVFPGTGYIEMAVAAASECYGGVPIEVTGVRFLKPIFMEEGLTVPVQLSLSESDGKFRIYARPQESGSWLLCAEGSVTRVGVPTEQPLLPAGYQAAAEFEIAGAELYDRFWKRGNHWGPAFRGVQNVWIKGFEAWSELEVPKSIQADTALYYCHPAIADACGHALAAVAPSPADGKGAFVGQEIDKVTIYRRPAGARMIAHAQLVPTSDPALMRGNVRVFDADGTPLSELQGAQLRYLEQSGEAASQPLYQVRWQEIAFVSNPGQSGEWLILGAQDSSLCNELKQAMHAGGVKPRLLTEKSESALRSALQSPTSDVICLWALGEKAPCGKEFFPEAVSLLRLMQILAEKRGARLWVVTSGLEDVAGKSVNAGLWQAPVRGLARSFAAEFPEWWGGHVDLDSEAPSGENAASLWRHVQSPSSEDHVALRSRKRFAARLQPYKSNRATELTLRPNCAYLITGGMGGLGLEMARWLADYGAKHLVLIGRTALPDRMSWPELTERHSQYARVQALRALEASGVSVHLGFFDVSDESALKSFVDEYARTTRIPIRGVLHAAGILEHGLIADLTPKQFAESMRPKFAAWNLVRALQNEELDFFVMFSSAAALLRSPRMGAYAAANSFLDAFAHQRRGQGKPAISINWGVWSGAGMASRFAAESVQSLIGRGMGSITTAQGLEVLARLIASPEGQIAVLPIDWQKWRELYPGDSAPRLLSEILEKTRAHIRPSATLVQVPADADDLLRYLTETLGAVLGFKASEVDPHLSISSFGLDSLTALEFKNRIDSDLQVSLPMVRFLEGPTLIELSLEVEPLWKQKKEIKPASSSDRKAVPAAQVDDLTDAEVDAALASILGNGGLQ